MTDVPVSHTEDALKLTSDAQVFLWEIRLRDGSKVFIRNGPKVTWQGNLYENLPILFNPQKIFGPMAHQGKFELATVIRREVLQQNLLADLNICVPRVWIIGQIQSCTSRSLDVQLRSPTDGPNMNVPYRYYGPPDFPTVTF